MALLIKMCVHCIERTPIEHKLISLRTLIFMVKQLPMKLSGIYVPNSITKQIMTN